MTKRRSNWYIYLITFVIAGVILYVVSNALLNSFYEANNDRPTSSDNIGTAFRPDASHNFTTLIMISKTADDVPEQYMTITYRGDANSFTIMPYLSSSSFGGDTLKQSYINAGAEAVMKNLTDAYGVEVKHYVKFSRETLIDFFDYVGNTTLTVPKEIRYEDPETKRLTVVYAGTYSFTGTQFHSYLTLPDYGEKDIQYSCKVQATSLCDFINQNFVHAASSTMQSVVDFIISNTDTNITNDAYLAKEEAIHYTLFNTNQPGDYYIPYGEQNGDKYIITDTSKTSIKDRISGEL